MICLICGDNDQKYLYKLHGISIWQCAGCGLISSHPHPTYDEVLAIYGSDNDPVNAWTEGRTEAEASERYLKTLIKCGTSVQKIILVAPPDHYFSSLAQKHGLDVTQHLTIREFE